MNRKRAVDKEVQKRMREVYAEKYERGDRAKFVNFADISDSAFYNYLNGKTRIDIKFLKDFCEFFNVSTDYILFGGEK